MDKHTGKKGRMQRQKDLEISPEAPRVRNNRCASCTAGKSVTFGDKRSIQSWEGEVIERCSERDIGNRTQYNT